MTNQFIQYNDLNNEILYQKCKPVTDIKRAEIQNIMTEMCEKITSKLDSVAVVYSSMNLITHLALSMLILILNLWIRRAIS